LNDIANAYFFAGDMKKIFAKELMETHGRPDVIITDPPRAGMDRAVIENILSSEARRIVYISCNPVTQARDIRQLSSVYRIVKSQMVDMFPHTSHIENIILLEA
jgi:23S rRNA (uracil1939-C5)-methyltransferase